MRFPLLFGAAGLGLLLLAAPHASLAQPTGGTPVRPNRNAQFVYRNGAVMQRLGNQLTPLAGNIRLPNGTKINVKSGIVEFPNGKITSLHENDYINAEGGIVFATPASAAAAKGDYSVAADAQYNKYVQVGTTTSTVDATSVSRDSAGVRELLLRQKIELLNRKVALLQQTHPNAPSTEAVDKQLMLIDNRLQAAQK